jgi:hypothetical protein
MAGTYDPPNPPGCSLASLLGAVAKAQKRKVYFSFHFDDIMRVNNVRQAWKIDHPDAPEIRSFYDVRYCFFSTVPVCASVKRCRLS